MKLLLCKNVEKLGIVGDIVEVRSGYARNYLIPYRLATEPTQTNIRAVAEARRLAEQERIRSREQLASIAQRLEGAEVTIRARANEEGVLYGSVGPREIADALAEEGHPVLPELVALDTPIRHLDNVSVEIKLADDVRSTVKVWVVREKMDEEQTAEGSDEPQAGKEADTDDERPFE